MAADVPFPMPLSDYPLPSPEGLIATLADRIAIDPFNAIASRQSSAAVIDTLRGREVADLAHEIEHRQDARARAEGRVPAPSVAAEVLHFFGEVEVVFGLWAVALLTLATVYHGWEPAKHYFNETVNYTEALFVVVIMALASTRPIIGFAEAALRRWRRSGGGTPVAWWVAS